MSDRSPSSMPAPAPTPQQKHEATDAQVQVKEESPSLPSPTTTATQHSLAPSSSPGKPSRQKAAAQRQAILRDDPLSGEVEPHRVYCRECERWIRLATCSEYAVANWQVHTQRCHASPTTLRSARRTPSKPSLGPSSRVATAERKIVLLNDPQVRSFSATQVQCSSCKTEVALKGEVDYDLTKWTEHKENCIPMTPAPITPQGSRPRANPPPSTSSTHSQVSAGRSGRSPTPAGEGCPSSNSTETTAVADSSPASVKVGVKRGRDEETEEEEEVAEDVDERPANRPRTETYKPPEKDAPGVFGWLMQPLKEFARGFREGLGSA